MIIVQRNAQLAYTRRFRTKRADQAGALALQGHLGLPSLPSRIEGFDISTFQGTEIVASMVVWVDGKMRKSEYRSFNIRGLTHTDDFASIQQAVERRYRRRLKELGDMPDVILIDGGRGQLNAALGALASLGVEETPIVALAKQEEEIYTPESPTPLKLPKSGLAVPAVSLAILGRAPLAREAALLAHLVGDAREDVQRVAPPELLERDHAELELLDQQLVRIVAEQIALATLGQGDRRQENAAEQAQSKSHTASFAPLGGVFDLAALARARADASQLLPLTSPEIAGLADRTIPDIGSIVRRRIEARRDLRRGLEALRPQPQDTRKPADS